MFNSNQLKQSNHSAMQGGGGAALSSRQRDKETGKRNLRQEEFRGMFEWENNLIPSLGCVLTALFTAYDEVALPVGKCFRFTWNHI